MNQSGCLLEWVASKGGEVDEIFLYDFCNIGCSLTAHQQNTSMITKKIIISVLEIFYSLKTKILCCKTVVWTAFAERLTAVNRSDSGPDEINLSHYNYEFLP